MGSLSVKNISQHDDNLKGVKTLKPVKNGHESTSLTLTGKPQLSLSQPSASLDQLNFVGEADTSYSDSKSLLLAAFFARINSIIILQLATKRAEPPSP